VYTAPCAAWHTPVFLLNSRLGRFAATARSFGARPTPRAASLLPKLRDQYAEFLDHVSLVHLRLLASPTCVGLRYGQLMPSSNGFSRRSTPRRSLRPKAPLALPSRPSLRSTYAVGRSSTRPPSLRSRVPVGLNEHGLGPESSPACHRLRLWGLALGPASPCADCHGAGTLGLTVRRVFTSVCAYSFRHPHFPSLHPLVSTGASPHGERSPTPDEDNPRQGHASAGRLIPTILGASPLDW
jgi:hypothetical protein